MSFAEYFFQDGGAGLSSLGFIYGIPLTLIGCSLQYAELGPVGTYAAARHNYSPFSRRGGCEARERWQQESPSLNPTLHARPVLYFS